MELKLIDAQGQVAGSVQAPDAVFAREYNQSLIHQIITSYDSNARQGTRAQKTRGEVKHSTKKPYRQKGTANARAGMSSSPLWRHGGRAFPNRPDENFSKKVNRKMYRAAMACILSKLVADDRLFVLEKLQAETHKTKAFAKQVRDMKLDRVLFIDSEVSDNLYLASNNLPNVMVQEIRYMNPRDLLWFDKIVFTKNAIDSLEGAWK